MPFMDTLSQYAKPIDTSGMAENMQQGLKTGMELAARNDQNQKLQQEIQFKKEQLEQAKTEHVTGLVDNLVKIKDPTLLKHYADYTADVAGKLGKPLSPTFLDAIQKSEGLRSAWLKDASERNMSDTATKYKKMGDSAGIMMGGPEDVAKFMENMSAPSDKVDQTRAMTESRQQTEAAKEQGALYDKRRVALPSPEWQRALRGDLGPLMKRRAEIQADTIVSRQNRDKLASLVESRDATAQAKAAGIDQKDRALDQGDTRLGQGQQRVDQGDRRLDQGDVKLTQADRGLNIRQQATDQQGKNINSLIGTRAGQLAVAKDRSELTKASLEMRGKALNLRQAGLVDRVEQGAVKNPEIQTAVKMMDLSDNALARLHPGIKWIEMFDNAAEYNQIITQNSRAAFAGEDRRTFSSMKSSMDVLLGKIANHEVGGPSDEEIQLWRNRVGALKDLYAKYHDNAYLKYMKTKANTGVLSEAVARTAFETNRKAQNAEWDAAGGIALPASKKPEIRSGTPGPLADRPAVMATRPPAAGTGGTAPAQAQDPQANAKYQAVEKQRAMNAINAVKAGTLKGVDEATIRAKYRLKMSQHGLNGDL